MTFFQYIGPQQHSAAICLTLTMIRIVNHVSCDFYKNALHLYMYINNLEDIHINVSIVITLLFSFFFFQKIFIFLVHK